MPDRCKPMIGLADCTSLGMVSINCPVATTLSMPMSSGYEIDELDIDETGAKTSKLMKVSVINDPKFLNLSQVWDTCLSNLMETSIFV